MIHTMFVILGFVTFAASDLNPAPVDDLKTYEAVRRKVGQDPAAQVKLALWCEAHGLLAERAKHLAIAIGLDPKNVVGRGLLGLVAYRGQWMTPADVRGSRESDAKLVQTREAYHARRAAMEGSVGTTKHDPVSLRKAARAHEKLGLWCDERGLKDESAAHFTTAVQLDPYHDAAWKHLGYLKHRGRWMSHAQINADEHEAAAQHKADRHWEPLLRKAKTELGEKLRRASAQTLLEKITDPRAVPSIIREFETTRAADQLTVVAMLRRFDSAAASEHLAWLAVFSEDPHVRDAAIEALKGRNQRDFVGGSWRWSALR